MWVSQRDTLQNSCTRPRTNRTVFVCEALVERMRASHSAAGLRVSPSSCSVSEVLKTSQSTFLSETDTRNNSWARTEEFKSFAPGEKKKSSLLVKPKTFQLMQTACVRLPWINHKSKTKETLGFLSSKGSLILSETLKAPASGSANSLQNDLLVKGHSSNFINTIFTQPQSSHHRRPDYTGEPTQPPPQTK